MNNKKLILMLVAVSGLGMGGGAIVGNLVEQKTGHNTGDLWTVYGMVMGPLVLMTVASFLVLGAAIYDPSIMEKTYD